MSDIKYFDLQGLFIRDSIAHPVAVIQPQGESGVLALALEHQRDAIIDDLAGRKCAATLSIPVRGTLGLVLVAKQRGVIPKARPVIEDMMQAGLYLSRKILDKALRRVGR